MILVKNTKIILVNEISLDEIRYICKVKYAEWNRFCIYFDV